MFRLKEKIDKNEVYIIAEMSANHGGVLENALKIVREVAKSGADCLKIQTYTADSITLDSDADDFVIKGGLWDKKRLYDLYVGAGTPYEWQGRIKEECDKRGIDFLSTPFDPVAVDFLNEIGCEAFKIASFELVDVPLIKYAASFHKPMIISCGMGTTTEIRDAVNACHEVGNYDVVLLKCCSEYPANWPEMHVSNIPDMAKRFKVPVGLSDHSAGSIASVVAVSMGACVIEKHVKLEGVGSEDSAFSMPIDEFSKLVSDVRAARAIMGSVKYGINPGEAENHRLRRSLFVSAPIKEGEEFTRDNVRSVRPATGLKTKYYEDILGRRATKDLDYAHPLCADDIEGFEGVKGMTGTDSDTDVSLGHSLFLRPATIDDCDLLFNWANDPQVRANSFNSDPIPYDNHVAWFNKLLSSKDQLQYILMEGSSYKDTPVGQIRISLSEDKKEGLIGYSIDPKFRGRGYGRRILELIQTAIKADCPEIKRLIGRVKEDNISSKSAFTGAGFKNEYTEFVFDI